MNVRTSSDHKYQVRPQTVLLGEGTQIAAETSYERIERSISSHSIK